MNELTINTIKRIKFKCRCVKPAFTVTTQPQWGYFLAVNLPSYRCSSCGFPAFSTISNAVFDVVSSGRVPRGWITGDSQNNTSDKLPTYEELAGEVLEYVAERGRMCI